MSVRPNVLVAAASASFLLAAALAAPVAAETTYTIPVWFTWNKAVLRVVVIPPAHGPIQNGDGVLPGGPADLLPGGTYLQATLDSIADWKRSIDAFAVADPANAWLGQVRFDVVVVSAATATAAFLGTKDIIVTDDETKTVILGLAATGIPGARCWVLNSMWWVRSFSYEDMYNVNGQEFGHCIGLNHVSGPNHDVMDGSYDDSIGAASGHLHCMSNLDVLGLTRVFGSIAGKPSGGSVSVPASAYFTYPCGP